MIFIYFFSIPYIIIIILAAIGFIKNLNDKSLEEELEESEEDYDKGDYTEIKFENGKVTIYNSDGTLNEEQTNEWNDIKNYVLWRDRFPLKQIDSFLMKFWPYRRFKNWWDILPLGSIYLGKFIIRWRIPFIYWNSLIFYLRNGFWPQEAWNFNNEFAKRALPRVKMLKEINHGISLYIYEECGVDPQNSTEEEDKKVQDRYDQILDEIIWALQYEADGRIYDDKWDQAEYDRYRKGMETFGKYYYLLSD